jgi:hypothetical protein
MGPGTPRDPTNPKDPLILMTLLMQVDHGLYRFPSSAAEGNMLEAVNLVRPCHSMHHRIITGASQGIVTRHTHHHESITLH